MELDSNSTPDSGITPIFVCGCGRSGTTMLGSMLGSHDQVLAVPESQFKTAICHEYDDAESRQDLLKRLGHNLKFRLWQLDGELDAIANATHSSRDLIEQLVEAFGCNTGKPDRKLWVDHTGSNLFALPVLKKHFPDAKIIHLLRDGRAVAASVLPLDWGPNSIRQAAHVWGEYVGAGSVAEDVYGCDVIRVYYEQLVESPEDVMQDLCRFIGIPYDERMTSGSGFHVPTVSHRQHAKVGSAPDHARINAWRDRLSARQIEMFEFHVGHMLSWHGYELMFDSASGPTRTENLHDNLVDAFAPYWKRLLYRIRHRKVAADRSSRIERPLEPNPRKATTVVNAEA